jgi:hypothetical protein
MDEQLPNLLIIGAAKAGTTSLHEYLDLHPAVYMTRPKELKFFNRPDWRSDIDGYKSHFAVAAEVRGESSPLYSMDPFQPSVPERIRELVPETRLIYLVRDPVERLIAQYVEFYALRLEDRGIDEALRHYESRDNMHVMASRYAYQLDRYREHFPDSQILVVEQRQLAEDRAGTMRRVFEFLQVDPEFRSPRFDTVHNERARKLRLNTAGHWLRRHGQLQRVRRVSRVLPDPLRERSKALLTNPVATPSLDPVLRSELAAYLREDADRLRAYTGMALDHWSA